MIIDIQKNQYQTLEIHSGQRLIHFLYFQDSKGHEYILKVFQ